MYIVAMLTMLIDHMGIVFFPGQDGWRIVGRIAMPIYAYCLVQGFRYTHSKTNYLRRLVLLGLISEIPYVIALQIVNINVIGTFVIALLVLIGLDRNRGKIASTVLVVAGCVVLETLPFDYGAYALLLVLVYKYLDSRYWVAAHLLLNLAFLMVTGGVLQMYSIISTLFLVYRPSLYEWLDKVEMKRWVWRSFYPAHLIVLAVIQLLFFVNGSD
ncbi:conjugal transfer protein TraX [Paenibacillus hemerocallicola]|uniref:Conjugal transfer protein TraX n=1 Tax=Paenibacillus hemerocallicola TaxID=1172614 RepID=A0A5C4T480_9BACL|nr:TraX family protein [Paenibacillus hemerocallicola]TNJ63823.1 conjugal transfer protein TraX [Paenibacillus hemerocallicola]